MARHTSADVLSLTPAQSIVRAERERHLREAMRLLPEQDREVLECLFWEEPPLPYQAVAERVGVALDSVSFLRARGLWRLENILADRVRHW